MPGLHLDLGHVGVYRALAAGAGIAGNGEDSELFAALRAKDAPGVAELTAKLPGRVARRAHRLARALRSRAATCWPRPRAKLPDTPAIRNALSSLAALAQSAEPHVEALHIDLADLTGYHYQNGAIFSVFTAGEPSAIGNGGRYDGIGKAFGRARPATGFTLDLRQLASVVLREAADRRQVLNRRRARSDSPSLTDPPHPGSQAWARTSSSSVPSGAMKAKARSSIG